MSNQAFNKLCREAAPLQDETTPKALRLAESARGVLRAMGVNEYITAVADPQNTTRLADPIPDGGYISSIDGLPPIPDGITLLANGFDAE
ncbi:MAG TPA: hypothetical protein VLE73_05990 [Candidatus Saccharimonadales bacterium]|nr:hypothetical protein [Candidatus Saccharimonadales bacterium]